MFRLKTLPKIHIIVDMGSNRQYKDSVFSFLFSDPAALRELYGAITGIELIPDTPVTINTLQRYGPVSRRSYPEIIGGF
jgi:hypothetical protein